LCVCALHTVQCVCVCVCVCTAHCAVCLCVQYVCAQCGKPCLTVQVRSNWPYLVHQNARSAQLVMALRRLCMACGCLCCCALWQMCWCVETWCTAPRTSSSWPGSACLVLRFLPCAVVVVQVSDLVRGLEYLILVAWFSLPCPLILPLCCGGRAGVGPSARPRVPDPAGGDHAPHSRGLGQRRD